MTQNTEPTYTRELAKDLFLAFYADATFFRAKLYRLLSKADSVNRKLLELVYPIEVSLWMEWYEGDAEGRNVFEKYGVYELLRKNSEEKALYIRRYGKQS